MQCDKIALDSANVVKACCLLVSAINRVVFAQPLSLITDDLQTGRGQANTVSVLLQKSGVFRFLVSAECSEF